MSRGEVPHVFSTFERLLADRLVLNPDEIEDVLAKALHQRFREKVFIGHAQGAGRSRGPVTSARLRRNWPELSRRRRSGTRRRWPNAWTTPGSSERGRRWPSSIG